MTPPQGKKRKTRRLVLIVDKIADRVITIGGTLVIAAVLGMMVFLIGETAPLFKSGEVVAHHAYRLSEKLTSIGALSVDDTQKIAVAVEKTGKVHAWHAPSGVSLDSLRFDLGGKTVTAFSQAIDQQHIAFGFSDGSVRLGRLERKSEVMSSDEIPQDLKDLGNGDLTDGKSVYSPLSESRHRKVWVEVHLEEEITAAPANQPIAGLDYRYGHFGERPVKTLAAFGADRWGAVMVLESKLNLFTRKLTVDMRRADIPHIPGDRPIETVLVTGAADTAYFAEKGGIVHRANVEDFDKPFIAESTRVTPEGVDAVAIGYLLGEGSMVVCSSDGSVNIYFRLRRADSGTTDGYKTVLARTLPKCPAAVTALSPGEQGKMFAVTDREGTSRLLHATSERIAAEMKSSSSGGGTIHATIAPRGDGLLTLDDRGQADLWSVHVPHPETSWKTLFGKVWYEGYPEPTYTWQSSGATDAFEPKLSLVPLMFGTMKATFYSLLFSIPVALLAAVYTSEFLNPNLRGIVKPSIEVMASIPSVVLGFVAALVLAPIVEDWISAVLLLFLVTPLSLVLAAYLWQLLPPRMSVRLEGTPKLGAVIITVCLAWYGVFKLGPVFEDLFFYGDFKGWLNGRMGTGFPFYFIMLFPLSAIAVAWTESRLFGRRLNAYIKSLPVFRGALITLIGRILDAIAACILSAGIAWLLQALGADPRGGFIGSYAQRNTLVVGFAMGFAVIPIIYTLAEDALTSVPEHLRAGSLACGATPWQTALWIVLPTAISGVFSAIMCGMGRAVGETMIVVMSAGNTPLLDINVFNGLRALSANIAVELPEAPKDGTLYRVLFLTGLVLFAMTFVINTAAELVRIHFRKRSAQM
jgi:phosphate transport system permease protein